MSDDRTQIISRTSTVEVGTELNQTYRIDALIAAGGMGEVFKGHNIQTGDPVAIKVVLPEFARDEMIYELFRKEARVLNHLSHDAIVRYYVFSLDRALGRPYLAMEFVDGPSLAARMKTEPLTPGDFFGLLRRLADGLHKAHDAGVIHRDISPDNVILPGGLVGNAKIIDFGIARSANAGGGTLLGGSFAGKYSYVSPEQLGLFGGEVTPKSDIYSLGLTMAAAVRGQAIDMSGSQVDVIEKRRVVPDLAAAGIPKALHPILTAMLQPDPAQRPTSMAEVRDWIDADLAKAQPKAKEAKSSPAKSSATPPKPMPARSNQAEPSNGTRNAAMALGVLAMIAVGGLGGWIYVQSQKKPTQVSQLATAAPATAAGSSEKSTDAPLGQATSAVTAQEGSTVAAATQQEPAKTQASSEPVATAVAQADPSPAVDQIKPAQDAAPKQPTVPPVQTQAKAPVAPKADVATLTRFVAGYGAGKCFKADVVSMSENSARIVAMGDEAGRSNFAQSFLQQSGFTPDLAFNRVTPEQCTVVSALSQLPASAKMPLQMKLDRTEIRGTQSGQSAMGDALNVSISGVGDRNFYVYVIDYAGGVQNINRACPNCIKTKSGEVTVSLSLAPPDATPGAPPQTYPMIILAVAAEKPLRDIDNQDAYESDAFVKPLLDSAGKAGSFAAQTAYLTLVQN